MCGLYDESKNLTQPGIHLKLLRPSIGLHCAEDPSSLLCSVRLHACRCFSCADLCKPMLHLMQMFCDKRVMHNVRNGWDIAKFLAEPSMADMAGHHANLK